MVHREVILALLLAGCRNTSHAKADVAYEWASSVHDRIDDLEKQVELLIRLQEGCHEHH